MFVTSLEFLSGLLKHLRVVVTTWIHWSFHRHTTPTFSRITVVVQGVPSSYDQILRQLNKLVDVVHAASHPSTDIVDREMALFKVRAKPDQRAEIFQIVEVFRAKTVDITDQSLVIETTGDSLKIDALEKLLEPMGLVEMVRSGKLIMKRGLEENLRHHSALYQYVYLVKFYLINFTGRTSTVSSSKNSF